MAKPSFTKIKEFNRNLWPLFREYFTAGLFTELEAQVFLDSHRKPNPGDYVLFKEIPENLKIIITYWHAYHVCKTFDGQSYMYLDNDFGHWIDNEYLKICPIGEIEKRSNYPSDFSID